MTNDRKALERELIQLRQKNEVVQKNRFFHFEGWGDQEDFLHASARIKLLLGGNRTGKSTAGIIMDLSVCMGVFPDGSREGLAPAPVHILVMVKDRRKATDRVIIKKLKHYCPSQWLKGGSWVPGAGAVKNGSDGVAETVTFYNDSTITLGSYSQDPDTHEGLDWYGVHFDEPPPYAHWIAIRRGLLDHGGRAWFTMTPRRCPWIHQEIFNHADQDRIGVYSLDLMDSPHISQDEKDQFIADLPPEEIESRIHGHFSHLQGQVFGEFERKIHTVDPHKVPDNVPRYMVMDPHDRRPTAMSWWYVDKRSRWICYDEWPQQDFYKTKTARMSVRDYASIIHTKEGRYKDQIVERLIDPNFGKTPSVVSGRTLIEEFSEYDLHFYGEINNDIALGHGRIHERLAHKDVEPGLFVFKNCMNMIRALEGYVWLEADFLHNPYSTRERVDEYGKDFIDMIRYLADYDPQYFAFRGGVPAPAATGRDEKTGY